jgi:hypothetical protein
MQRFGPAGGQDLGCMPQRHKVAGVARGLRLEWGWRQQRGRLTWMSSAARGMVQDNIFTLWGLYITSQLAKLDR